MGIEHERHHRHVSPAWIFYRSITIAQLVYGGCYHGQADLDAFLCVEVRAQNRNVLSPNQVGCRCNQVYTRQEKGRESS